MQQLISWIDQHLYSMSCDWYIKRLSRNDTLANTTHQAGPYIPKSFMFHVLPDLHNEAILNPRVVLRTSIGGQTQRDVTAIWYNNKLFGQTRNEVRLTNFGGQESILLHPDSTGSIAIFAFYGDVGDGQYGCDIWVSQSREEEDYIQEVFGAIEPNTRHAVTLLRDGSSGDFRLLARPLEGCVLRADEIDEHWHEQFPSSTHILHLVLRRRPFRQNHIDELLMNRRECEYVLFQSIEEVIVKRRLERHFTTVHDFVAYAQTVLQRRKARSGRSLELHVHQLLQECGLQEDVHFSYNKVTEQNKTPDFVFPSARDYNDRTYPAHLLRMLAVKTTVKDRWRQILHEADRIPMKHLLTLQEGVSDNQWLEMKEAGVVLVVPRPIQKFYPVHMRNDIVSLEEFVRLVRDGESE